MKNLLKKFKLLSELIVTDSCDIFLFRNKGSFGKLVADYSLENADWFLINL